MVGLMMVVDSKILAMSTIDFTKPLCLDKRPKNPLVALPIIVLENPYVALIPTIRCLAVNIRWWLTRKKWLALAWDHLQFKEITRIRCTFVETTTQLASRPLARQTAMLALSITENYSTKEAWEERKKRGKLFRWPNPSKMNRSLMDILSNLKSIEFLGIWKESTMKKQRTFWSSMARQLGTKSILRGSRIYGRRQRESASSHKQIRFLQRWWNRRKWGTHPRGADTPSLIVFTKTPREGRRDKSLSTVPVLSQSALSSPTRRRQSSLTLSKPQWRALFIIRAKFSRDFPTVWATARIDQGCWSKTQMASQMIFLILKQARSFSSQEWEEVQFIRLGPKIQALSFIKKH